MHFSPAEAAQFQQIVNQRGHTLAGLADPVQIVLALLIQLIPVIIYDDTAEAVQGPQGLPQIMGDRIAEGFQFFVGEFQVGGIVFQGPFGPLALGDIVYHANRPDNLARIHP